MACWWEGAREADLLIAEFAPGSGVGIIGERAALWLPEPIATPQLQTLVELVLAGGSELGQEVARTLLAGGKDSLPPFALVCFDNDAATFFVRGEASVALVTAAAEFTADGVGLGTWLEQRVVGAPLSAAIGKAPSASFYQVRGSGVVPADGLRLVSNESAPVLNDAGAGVDVDWFEPSDLSSGRAPAPSFEAVAGVRPDLRADQRSIDEVPPGQVTGGMVADPLGSVSVDELFGSSEPTPAAEPSELSESQTELSQVALRPDKTVAGAHLAALRAQLAAETPVPASKDEATACGALTFDDGEVIALTSHVVIGRAPGRSPTVAGEPALPVSLADPQKKVSGRHAELRVSGSRVEIVDCGSTNHTWVTLPGQPSVKLQPGQPMLLTSGAHVDLAGARTFSYRSG